MTQMQLEYAVAVATGESVRTVHALGFGLAAAPPGDLEPEDLGLFAACPRCQAAAPLPARRNPDRLDFAACPRCALAFDYRDDEVFAAPSSRPRGS